MDTDSKIKLNVSNGTAHVWLLEDIARLRREHQICGLLTGTLPHVAQQNVFLGLPLQLMPEEVVLLIEHGAAVLVDEQASHRIPTGSQLNSWQQQQKSKAQSSIPPLVDSTLNTPNLSEDQIQKRRLREEKRLAAAQRSTTPTEVSEDRLKATDSSNALQTAYNVDVPGASVEHPWYSPIVYESLESARAAGLWTFPNTQSEKARCAVFHDLWKQGYFMGIGIKFGGDWLVYPGDPLRYHSHFVATVHGGSKDYISPMEVVAHGRLGTATRKSHLLCKWHEQEDRVEYFSIEWAGFG
ncbi:tRNA-intron endonuclease catalytic domain-like protein [Sistotremastrum suecicum HHB10207 ss-3]|uniref:tRNA-splicing endonuclease subunit Sen34 n=1 Tax=Sistotremastrum suecicum HHB10207 ss-3 TaxID=1314776 RepID=A0A166IXV7_9AGAM|nr:tRNA-intron endonuclease catalytic domain-like protein [Sistotremastrum suecicum HHB10207 ss-3]